MSIGRYCLRRYCLICSVWLFSLMSSQNAWASIVITNGLTHTHAVKGGVVYSGVIGIQNTADVAQNVRLYQKDYTYSADGRSHYEDPGQNPRSNLHWIELNTNLLTLEAKGKMEVLYEITVPHEMEAGSYWSVIMVEPVADIQPSNERASVQIRSIVRYSIQIVTTNDHPARALLQFMSFQLAEREGERVLDIAIANAGDLYHVVETSMTVFDRASGEQKGVFRTNKLSLLPQNSKRFTMALRGLEPGAYRASVVAVTQDEEAFGINIELEVPDE